MAEETKNTSLKLYDCLELEKEITALAEQNGGELTDEQLQQLVLAQTTSLQKLGNLCGFMRSLELGIDACRAEEARIAEMRKRAENRLKNIKNWLVPFVAEKGRVQVGTFVLSTRKSEAVKLVDGFNVAGFMREVPARLEPDKDKIKEALKAGERIEGAELERRTSLQIK